MPKNNIKQARDFFKYKTAAAEERAILRRTRAYRAKLMKEIEGMTDEEECDYINRLGEALIDNPDFSI